MSSFPSVRVYPISELDCEKQTIDYYLIKQTLVRLPYRETLVALPWRHS